MIEIKKLIFYARQIFLYQANINQKKAEIIIFISDKRDFKNALLQCKGRYKIIRF